MADIPLRDVIDNLRSRLQTELEAELATLADTHDHALDAVRREAAAALDDARREAAAQAEQQWAGRLEAVRADWSARLQNEVTAARTEAERQAVAEAMRARVDAEQAAAESAADIRRDMEQTLAAERARADEALRAERARAERDLAEARAAFDAEQERTSAVMDQARAAAPAIDTSLLIAALRAIDDATSLTGVLAATVRAASAEAPRATMLIVNGAELDEWTAPDIPSLHASPMRVDGREAGFLSHVLKRGEPVTSGQGLMLPAFAAIGPDRRAIGAPVMLGGQPVAVLYADEGPDGQPHDGWMDAVQILARHAAASLACITAQRTLQALGGSSGAAPLGASPVSPQSAASAVADDGEGARRYARLLVSEIKLYNEAAVRTGRERRDISQRLRPEIDRARRLYEERVPAAVAARDMYFHQELVQTLAGGDPLLLG